MFTDYMMKKERSESVSCLVVSDSCDPMDCSPPGSSVHGVFQARILEWVAIPFFRGSFWPRIKFGFPALQTDSLPSESPRNPLSLGWTSWIASNKWKYSKSDAYKIILASVLSVALSHWLAWAILAAMNFPMETSMRQATDVSHQHFQHLGTANCHACEIWSRSSLVKFGDRTKL